ncbi:MAG: hypothetical protein SGPRY_002350 [Prymnesium sp.]
MTLAPREMVESAAAGIEQLRTTMREDQSELGNFYRMWTESIYLLTAASCRRPAGFALNLFAEALDRVLFSERLPKNYRPRSALDLLNNDVQREVLEWIDKAAKDLACVEEFGPRKEGISLLLLDYQAPIHTDFHLPRLKRMFPGYPDQRLASNVLDGVIRLEAGVELQNALHPKLVSVGNGYDSVHSTVRELASRGFYYLHRLKERCHQLPHQKSDRGEASRSCQRFELDGPEPTPGWS